jgi:hypothetical protein
MKELKYSKLHQLYWYIHTHFFPICTFDTQNVLLLKNWLAIFLKMFYVPYLSLIFEYIYIFIIYIYIYFDYLETIGQVFIEIYVLSTLQTGNFSFTKTTRIYTVKSVLCKMHVILGYYEWY